MSVWDILYALITRNLLGLIKESLMAQFINGQSVFDSSISLK